MTLRRGIEVGLSFLFMIGGVAIDSLTVALLGLGLLLLPLFTAPFAIKKNERITDDLVRQKLNEHEFNAEKLLIANDLKSAIAINPEDKRILLLSKPILNEEFRVKEITFDDVIEVKITRNSETLTSTSRGSQVAGATVGGLAFGGVGMLLGGLSASKTSSQLTKRLSLELVINDLDYPIFETVFIKRQNGIEENSDLFNDLTKDLDQWYRMFTVILYQNKLNIVSS